MAQAELKQAALDLDALAKSEDETIEREVTVLDRLESIAKSLGSNMSLLTKSIFGKTEPHNPDAEVEVEKSVEVGADPADTAAKDDEDEVYVSGKKKKLSKDKKTEIPDAAGHEAHAGGDEATKAVLGKSEELAEDEYEVVDGAAIHKSIEDIPAKVSAQITEHLAKSDERFARIESMVETLAENLAEVLVPLAKSQGLILKSVQDAPRQVAPGVVGRAVGRGVETQPSGEKLNKSDVAHKMEQAVRKGDLPRDILSRLDVDAIAAIREVPEAIAKSYGIPILSLTK